MSNPFYFKTTPLVYGVVVFFAMVLALIYSAYQWQVDKACHQEYGFYQTNLSEKIGVLVKEKSAITQAIALSVSANPIFNQALLNRHIPVRPTLIDYSNTLKTHTGYQNVWIQLIDAQGVSLARSWTEKQGDDLAKVRLDLASLIKQPRHLNDISVGKFNLTFKSMVPLFNGQQQLMGVIEVITQVGSIDRYLHKKLGVRSVVLVDPDYQSQLVHVPRDRFLDGYFVANKAALTEDTSIIQQLGVQKSYQATGYLLTDQYLVVTYPLLDLKGKKLANWVSLKPLDSFQFVNLAEIQQQFIMTAIFVMVLLALLVAIIYFKRQADFERRFFFQVFDTATEIVFVLKSRFITLANKRFFEFFSGFKSIEAFHQHHECICEFFVEEPGYLAQTMSNKYWLEYLLSHADVNHYAKIRYQNQETIFLIKASEITNVKGERYISVLMSDVTENYLYKQRLEQLATHDELTGIYNRHYFNQVLDRELKRQQRYQTPLSIALMDIDLFKNINDQYGHDVGDAVLKKLTHTIGDLLRETDVFCRVGGEEFIVIFPQTDLPQATLIAERIRAEVAEMVCDHFSETITVSVGVVEAQPSENQAQFYKRADQLLYQAKQQGRNRVESEFQQ